MVPVDFRVAGAAGRWLILAVWVGACLVASAHASPANPRELGFAYVSPLPESRLVSPRNNVVLRALDPIEAAGVRSSQWSVIGSQSGRHSGRVTVCDDSRTVVFTPDLPFTEGERVTVSLASGIRTRGGGILPEVSYAFSITPRDPQRGPRLVADETTGRLVPLDRWMSAVTAVPALRSGALAATGDSLPVGMPPVSVLASDRPDPGDIFLAPFSGFRSNGHLMILDNAGQPIFYRKLPGPAFDFKRQPNGLLTYFSGGSTYWALDSTYAVVDSFKAGNGYVADLHDLQLLPNGHALLMIYDPEPVPMDSIVPGGLASALVVGLVVQELDQAKNVVFQWRSWDHFQITDADTCIAGLRDSVVDYVHGNALELDTDGNVLISSRSMNEITKIDRNTGEVIWRWGPNAKNNQFTSVNDPRGFAAQHDIRRLPNGNVTLFDNSNCPLATYSRGVEYQLDEVNKIATLVWEYRTTPDTYTPFMGNVQREGSGCTLIGWGGAGPDPKITDVRPNGSIALALGLGSPTTWTYRAFRYPWRTTRFAATPDPLHFDTVLIGNSQTLAFTLWNPSTQPITINSIAGGSTTFSVLTPLPMTLGPGQSDSVQVRFLPPEPGSFADTLYVRSVGPTELITQPVTLLGSCNATGIWIEDCTQYEGNAYRAPFVFRLHLAAPRTKFVSVAFQTVDGTAKVSDSDYLPTSYRAYFAPGDTVTWLWVYVNGDHKEEGNETFMVRLSNPANAVIDRAQAVGTILDDDAISDVGDANDAPLAFALHPSMPNPGHGSTAIHYDLPRECRVRLDVFDLSGRRVESLVDRIMPAGRHEVTWAPKGETAGVFFYRLWAGEFTATRKVVLVR